MTSMAQHINEMKRKHEHAVRIQEIQSQLSDWDGADLTTYGDLVLEVRTVVRNQSERFLNVALDSEFVFVPKFIMRFHVASIRLSCGNVIMLQLQINYF